MIGCGLLQKSEGGGLGMGGGAGLHVPNRCNLPPVDAATTAGPPGRFFVTTS